MVKIVLHLCADVGSDTRYYDLSDDYTVIKVGSDIGVEYYSPPENVHGIIANPVCTELSTARSSGKARDVQAGMSLVWQCQRIIREANPTWWAIENPATGALRTELGKPNYVYQPWWYGSPWTKKTALWGNFTIPPPLFTNWSDVPKNDKLYTRPTRSKPSLAFLHKSAVQHMPEYQWCAVDIDSDMHLRSLCSDGFAKAFFDANP